MTDQNIITLKFNPQSYKWGSVGVKIDKTDGIAISSPRSVKLFETKSGNYTEYHLKPGGDWHGEEIHYSGEVQIKNGKGILAIVSSGSWSGGSNYNGYVFGQPGCVILFSRKGKKEWLSFTQEGIIRSDIEPGKEPTELV